MLNSWLELYLYFCTITTIFSLYKLYLPCWKQIQKETDLAAQKIKKRPVLTLLIFTLTVFALSPLFFMFTILNVSSDAFIKGFVKGSLGK